jgi:quinol monooxygenase YgiN
MMAVLNVFVGFDCRPNADRTLLAELMLILEPTRAEAGCVGIHLYESLREPLTFVIHSTWVDEAAFNAHATLPHMVRFLGVVDDLVTHPVHAVRTIEVG